MPKHRKEDVEARIERVGQQSARRVPIPEIARSLNVSERQVRYDRKEWLKRRKAERATEGLEVEERLAQCDEALQAAWRDYDLLGNGPPDSKVVRARSELLRLALSIIDRQASFLDPSTLGQGATAEVDSNVINSNREVLREIRALFDRWHREERRRRFEEAGFSYEGGGGNDGGT
jgi:DNA-binding Lrp family transcriptional regulator